MNTLHFIHLYEGGKDEKDYPSEGTMFGAQTGSLMKQIGRLVTGEDARLYIKVTEDGDFEVTLDLRTARCPECKQMVPS